MFSKKHLSGAEKRKKRKLAEESKLKQKGSLDKFIKLKPIGSSSVSNERDDTNVSNKRDDTNMSNDCDDTNVLNERDDTNVLNEPDDKNLFNDCDDANFNNPLDIYDPRNWNVLDNKTRDILIEKGPIREMSLVFPKDTLSKTFLLCFLYPKIK